LALQSFQTEYWPDSLPGKQVIRTVEAAQELERILTGQPKVVFDLETSGLTWFRSAEAVGAAFAAWLDGQLRCWYIPFRHQVRGAQIPEEIAVSMIGRILRSVGLVIGHNIKFDEHFSRREGWGIGDRYDTMIAGALYNENCPLELETRAERHLGLENTRHWKQSVHAEIAGLAKASRMNKTPYLDRYGYSEVPINLLGLYACHDVWFTGALYDFFEKRNVSSTYSRIWPTEMELTRILCDMECHGLLVDVDYIKDLRSRLLDVQAGYSVRLRQFLGNEFRPGADADVRALLYDRYKLDVVRLTPKGDPSVESEVLQYYSNRIPILQVLRAWREAEKLATTYTDSILKRIDADGICHPDFQQVGTITGRMSCRAPNFQNQPVDNKKRAKVNGGLDPWSIRRAFIVPNSLVRLFFDYSQVELRMLAFYTRDPIMVDVYLRDGDIHERTQMEVASVLRTEVLRRRAKIINFGLSYCLTPQGLARQSGMSEPDARAFYAAFESRYSGIGQFRSWFWNDIRSRQGQWFANLWGRRRRVPRIVSHNKRDRRRAERQAIGTLIQGQAAELTKESLVRVDRLIRERNFPAKLCNVVHDDIQIDCDPKILTELVPQVKAEMERYPEFDPIPIKVDGDYSTTSWSQKLPLPM
jgi:DNA polymerase-1